MRLKPARHAQIAAPRVADGDVFQRREQLTEQIAAKLYFVVGEIEAVPQTSTKLLAAACAKHQPVISGTLAVGHLFAELAERLPL